MKKSILKTSFLLFTFFTGIELFAQFPTEWSSIGTQWAYTYLNLEESTKGITHIIDIGDTLISGKQVRKMQKKIIDKKSLTFSMIYMYYENNKMYYYSHSLKKHNLLFDYNLQVNDTLNLEEPHTIHGSVFTIKVDSINFVTINKAILKKYFVHTIKGNRLKFNAPLLEKIGCLEGMFPQDGLNDFWVEENLQCYKNGSFNYPEGTDCDIILDIPVENNLSTFKVMNNPVNDVLEILVENNQAKDFKLVNMQGESINVESTVYQDRTLLNMEHLPKGMYFLHSSTTSVKIIKN